jgi:sterol desaturase/sphingolipid hydroxylase (fatty acid hydroxylase superfamily)
MEPALVLIVGYACALILLIAERFEAEPGRPWLTANLLADAAIGTVRLAIVSVLLGGFILAAQQAVQDHIAFLRFNILDGQPGWTQFITYFVVMDAAYYLFHRVMHSTKTLWVFHAVHHSQTRANPMMATRSHVLEEIVYVVSRVIPPVILGGSPPAIFAFLIVDQFWSFLVHSDLKWNLGPLKYVLVTPQFHRIHHSIEVRHFDKNFGGRLIVWDYLFGTMNPRFDEYPEIGIADYPVVETSRSPAHVAWVVWSNLAYPFVALWRHFVVARGEDRQASAPVTEPVLESEGAAS